MPGENIQDWSVTAVNNSNSDTSINWAEGQTRASVNNSARSMMAAHAKDRNLHNGSIVTGGTANAQTFTSGVTYTTVPTGLRVLLKIGPSLTNTATATLEMDGLGAVGIKTIYAADLVGGEIVADSYAEFVYNGTNWVLLQARPWAADRGGIQKVATQTASNSPFIDFTSGVAATYDEYQVVMTNVVPATEAVNLTLQVGFGSPSVIVGPADYVWNIIINRNGALTAVNQITTGHALTSGQASNPVLPASGKLIVPMPSLAAFNIMRWETAYLRTDGNQDLILGSGYYRASGAPITGLRFLMSSGNITTGTFSLYGVAK